MNYLKLIREQKPLIHHITNWVTIYDCAQTTRSVGALPVMAHAPKEVTEMVNLASTLVLNIGTLTSELIETMIIAAQVANKKGIPVILDIVGAGATKLRTKSVLKILQKAKIDILKGNAGEIGAIAGARSVVKGVESISVEGNLEEISRALAKKYQNVVVVTGKVDLIATSQKIKKCDRGHEMMGRVVGTGCMVSSIIGSFAAVSKDYFDSSFKALDFYNRAGERAAKKTKRPLEFKMKLIDNLAD